MKAPKEFSGDQSVTVARRMLRESRKYFAGANALGELLDDTGNSRAILKLISFEIALKALVLAFTQKRPSDHKYVDHWAQIDATVQGAVLADATYRGGESVDFSNASRLFLDWKCVFEKGRYEYEFGDDYSTSEAYELGQDWVAKGAPDDEADLRYHSFELTVLIESLHEALLQKLA